jgi:hypothetical protein
MNCPNCQAVIPDKLLQCSRCGASVALTVATADGQMLGPYSVHAVQRFLADGRLSLTSSASLAGGAWRPLPEVLAGLGAATGPAPQVRRRASRAPGLALALVLVLLAVGALVVVWVCVLAHTSPYDGKWSGNGGGARVTFRVRYGQVNSFSIEGPEGTHDIDFGPRRPMISAEGAFGYTDGDLILGGTFTSKTEAEGVYTKTGESLPWTARRE